MLMKSEKNTRIACIIYSIKHFLKNHKLRKILERTFTAILLSAISSVLGFLVLYIYPQINRGAMIVAIIVFSYSLFEYTFRYSFLRKHSRPYWIDVLIPWGMFSFLACAGYFFIPPKIFNYIFLPLRVCELFYLRSWFSILIVLVFVLLLMSATRYLGRKTRRRHRRERH